MKIKTIFSILCAAGLSALPFACQKTQTAGTVVTLHATSGSPQGRMDLNDDGLSLKWEDGDQIFLYDENARQYSFVVDASTISPDGRSADFKYQGDPIPAGQYRVMGPVTGGLVSNTSDGSVSVSVIGLSQQQISDFLLTTSSITVPQGGMTELPSVRLDIQASVLEFDVKNSTPDDIELMIVGVKQISADIFFQTWVYKKDGSIVGEDPASMLMFSYDYLPVTIAPGKSFTSRVVLNPCTITDGAILLKIDGREVLVFKKDTPLTLVKGKRHKAGTLEVTPP